MAALKAFFSSSGSIASTAAEKSHREPDRQDVVLLEWAGRHRYVRSATIINGMSYPHRDTSMTKCRKGQITQAVYLMTTLRRIRRVKASIEMELKVLKDSLQSVGALYEPEMPQELISFLTSDITINTSMPDSAEPWSESDLWMAAEGILGMLSLDRD